MRHSRLAAPLVCAVLVCSWIAVGDDVALAPRRGVLLLANGELIEGTVTLSGDRYDVELTDAEISVKRADVAAFCASVRDCYLHKLKGIDDARAQDHLDLAEWCLRHGLIDEAEKEIAEARGLDASHPKIKLLAPRLELAKHEPAPRKPVEPSGKTAASEGLDSLVRNMPGGSMPGFTNTIQPMLLNHCSKSGCHSARSAHGMRLERISPNRLTGRNATQRNLSAVLAMIDREKPADSRLLTAPIRAHGNMKAPIFTDRDQAQYRQLVEWVYQVSASIPPRPTLEERAAPLLQNLRGENEAVRPASATSNETAPPPAAPKLPIDPKNPPMGLIDSLPAAAPSTIGETSGQDGYRLTRVHGQVVLRQAPKRADDNAFVPKDPFDPEIFNRRYFSPPPERR